MAACNGNEEQLEPMEVNVDEQEEVVSDSNTEQDEEISASSSEDSDQYNCSDEDEDEDEDEENATDFDQLFMFGSKPVNDDDDAYKYINEICHPEYIEGLTINTLVNNISCTIVFNTGLYLSTITRGQLRALQKRGATIKTNSSWNLFPGTVPTNSRIYRRCALVEILLGLRVFRAHLIVVPCKRKQIILGMNFVRIYVDRFDFSAKLMVLKEGGGVVKFKHTIRETEETTKQKQEQSTEKQCQPGPSGSVQTQKASTSTEGCKTDTVVQDKNEKQDSTGSKNGETSGTAKPQAAKAAANEEHMPGPSSALSQRGHQGALKRLRNNNDAAECSRYHNEGGLFKHFDSTMEAKQIRKFARLMRGYMQLTIDDLGPNAERLKSSPSASKGQQGQGKDSQMLHVQPLIGTTLIKEMKRTIDNLQIEEKYLFQVQQRRKKLEKKLSLIRKMELEHVEAVCKFRAFSCTLLSQFSMDMLDRFENMCINIVDGEEEDSVQ